MRPVVEARRRYDIFDILRLIPRSVVDIDGVTRNLIQSTAGWGTALLVLGAIFGPVLAIDLFVRDALDPSSDELRTEIGEPGYWAIMLVLAFVLLGTMFLLLWGAVRLCGDRMPLRSLALAFVASGLPILPVTIVSLGVFALAVAAGLDTSTNSPFYFADMVVVSVLSFGYLALALAAAGPMSIVKASAATLLGPGALMALLVWLMWAFPG